MENKALFNKEDNSIEIKCECGNIHIVSEDSEGNLNLTTFFKKEKNGNTNDSDKGNTNDSDKGNIENPDTEKKRETEKNRKSSGFSLFNR